MSINNHNAKQGKIERESQRNLSLFTRSFNSLRELGENDKMFTNIDDMKNKLNKLVEEGHVEIDDIELTQLNGFLDGALQIHLKPQKTDTDIINFYTTYNNFEDIHKHVREGNS